MISVRTTLTTAVTAVFAATTVLAVGATAAQAAEPDPSDTAVAVVDAPAEAAEPDVGDDESSSEDSSAPDADVPETTTKAALPSAADVFGTLKASPAGPYADGQTVTLTYSGFEPNTQIVASTCIGGITLGGPGDCAPLNGPGSAITAADGSGKGKVTVKVIEGNLGATDKPSARCGNGADEKCVFSVTDFSGNGPAAIPVTYKAAGGGSAGEDTSGGSDADDSGSGSGSSDSDAGNGGTASSGGGSSTDATGGGTALAATGPSDLPRIWGSVALALGVMFVLVARRRVLGGVDN